MAKVTNRKWTVKTIYGLVRVFDTDGEIAAFRLNEREQAEELVAKHNAAIDMEIQEYDELLDKYTDLESRLDEEAW